MRQQSIIITLGIIQAIILTLFGIYFYRLIQRSSGEVVPMQPTDSAVESH